MKKENQHVRFIGFITALGTFLITQLVLIFFSNVWSPNFRDLDGTLFGRIANSSLFTEWFAPYDMPLYNMLTAFFAITLIPSALLSLFGKKDR
ncbi:hypothetical protein D8M04_17490 [Oceanobacillus piezotolerans]|uniref:YfzA family protein n=1 Tax=Oceanobacillus piezotolerans TaxID=2448030 RepID=A0A498D5B3_9BACI|nr:YfzA family protein [Oceanobacillus piezotolerans]RLL41361.1 hypothetical protein D8M04_17490 [Oceanobacillus piezotolerans]